MDATSSDIIQSLQARVRDLEQANAALVAADESRSLIAAHALRALGLQADPLRPEGFWIATEHEDTLNDVIAKVEETGAGNRSAKEMWKWHKFSRTVEHGALPVFPKSDHLWRYKPHSYEVRPFQHSFPVEVFEAIISCADRQAISRTARASFACYQLFMPVLLDVVGYQALQRVSWQFKAGMHPSSRLESARNFQYIRTVDLSSTWLRTTFSDEACTWLFDRDRLPVGSTTLDLDVLTIAFDEERDFWDRPESSYQFLGDESAYLLSLLDPKKLVLYIDEDSRRGESEPGVPYIVSEKAAEVMCSWTKLEIVILDEVNVVKPCPDDDINWDFEDVFFLSARNSSVNDLDIVWDLAYGFGSNPCDLLVRFLFRRDDTLRQPWVKSFTINFGSETVSECFKRAVAAYEDDVPSCLQWKVHFSD